MTLINLLLLLLAQSLRTSLSFSFCKPKSRTAWLKAQSGGQGGGIFYDGPQHEYSDSQQPSSVPSGPSFDFSASPNKALHKDVVVIGGGLAGLSAALYLSQVDPSKHITILERETEQQTTVASFAAAGMLAPQSERLPVGPLLDLCVASRQCYRDFVDLVEGLAQESGEEGKQYLTYGDGKVGYVASGGFLAPAFAGDTVATWSPPDATAKWLDATQIRELEPSLNPDVVGGWWFPEDASVDARKLTCALRAACVASGVEIKLGKEFEVSSLDLLDGECRGLYFENGKYMKTKTVLVANGSWMRQLLPIPVDPHKGQSLSLRMPADKPPILKRVLFAQDSYIVPKSDGRIVVGATVEAGSFDPNVTPAGIMHILHHAMQLVPGLADLPIEETWVGLRPTTPDKGPILGKTSWSNLFLAGGYWRNGVLLAPKTGQMLAQLIAGQELSASDQALMDAFSWDRFTTPEGSKKMEMNARFAASMHPVHRRTEGAGIAASVGTELGSYSTARAAKDERAKDRASLFGGLDDSLEKAAQMGTEDASAFSGYEPASNTKNPEQPRSFPENQYIDSLQPVTTTSFEGSADAYTVQGEQFEADEGDSILDGYQDIEDAARSQESAAMMREARIKNRLDSSVSGGVNIDENDFPDISQQAPAPSYPEALETTSQDLHDIYQKIQSNKAVGVPMGEAQEDEPTDPGFRIHYVDPETREKHEVPPFTNPDDMQRLVAEQKGGNGLAPSTDFDPAEEYSETTFDGYTAIQEANSRSSREGELEAMRAARMKNRGLDDVDVSKIGVRRAEDMGR